MGGGTGMGFTGEFFEDFLWGAGYGLFYAQCEGSERTTFSALLIYRRHPWYLSWLDSIPTRRIIVADVRPFARLRRESEAMPILLLNFTQQAKLSDEVIIRHNSPVLRQYFSGYRLDSYAGQPLDPLKILREVPQPTSDEEWFGANWH